MGCQPTTEKQAATAAPQASPAARVGAAAAASPVPAAPSQNPSGYYRYRGTVGTQLVTVELTVGPPPLTEAQAAHAQDFIACTGSCHYDRHPAGQLLLSSSPPFRPGQLLLTEADSAHPRQPTGRWQATQPFGPVLTGTWRSPAGQVLPFSLHEDFTDGQGHLMVVQYEILQEGDEMPTPSEREPGETKAAYRARTEDLTNSCRRDYLHLLGPDTLRPELRALQCPGPARRRRDMREDLGYPGGVELQDVLTVAYDDYGLLSLASSHLGDYKDAVHPEHGAGAITYDLRTGRALTIAGLIRPGTDTTLSRLITQHLGSDEQIPADDLMSIATIEGGFAQLPEQGLGVVEEGLTFTYSGSEILPAVYPPVTLLVPWAELQPLLRPDSPVARMLRARGLWRAGNKK